MKARRCGFPEPVDRRVAAGHTAFFIGEEIKIRENSSAA